MNVTFIMNTEVTIIVPVTEGYSVIKGKNVTVPFNDAEVECVVDRIEGDVVYTTAISSRITPTVYRLLEGDCDDFEPGRQLMTHLTFYREIDEALRTKDKERFERAYKLLE